MKLSIILKGRSFDPHIYFENIIFKTKVRSTAGLKISETDTILRKILLEHSFIKVH